MPESTQIMFSFKELAEILVKKQDLHEGNWGIVVRFGIGAATIAVGGTAPLPTALVPILEMGIQRENEPTALTVNAAEVNPAPPSVDAAKKASPISSPPPTGPARRLRTAKEIKK